ncbi:MAG TPA: hypothetical protein VFP13_08580 [Actinomycetota bacterium]|nr:hypothetical protein [Actinomycetota bacterium]
MTLAPDVDAPNRFTARVRDDAGVWSVAIVDPDGRETSVRACRGEAEARAFASTVRQHVAWLSEARFRRIYRLDDGV